MSHLNPTAGSVAAPCEQGALSRQVVDGIVIEAADDADELAQAIPVCPRWVRLVTIVASSALLWALIIAAVAAAARALGG